MRRTELQTWSLWAAVLGSVLVFALCAVHIVETGQRGAQRLGFDLVEEGSTVHVDGLVPGGPADRAGLDVGDRVVSVAGVEIEVLEDYDQAARTFRRGRSISVGIERNDACTTLTAVPGMPAPWARTFGRIAVGLLSLVIGIIALAGRSGDVRARLLSALFFLIALEFAWPDGLRLDSLGTLVGPVFFYVVTGAQLAIELHLAAVLPRPRAWPRRRRIFIVAAYTVGSWVALVGTLSYLVESVRPFLLPWSVYQFDELVHQLILPAWAITMVGLLAYATARAPGRKGRLRAGMVLFGVLPWTVYILAGWWLGYPDRTSFEGWAVVMPILVFFFPISVFMAIFRYQLFDLEIVVRRGLVYSTLTSVLVGLFYAVLGAGGAILSQFVEAGGRSVIALAAASVLLGLLFSPLRRGVQLIIDRKFFPEREAMRRRLIDLAAELPARADAASMGQHLASELCRIFHISSATVLLADAAAESLERLARSGPRCLRETAPPTIAPDDPWVAELGRIARPIYASQLKTRGASAILARLAHAPSVVAPLMVGKRLVAVLILGEKNQATRYSKEEAELLGLLAHHCAIAFDNARLVRSVTYEGLTGLLRREAVLDLLEREVARATRYSRPLTVALADIDHFKRVNDGFGHLEGDQVLRAVARELSARVRSSDAVGRYGGEEFLLVFPETSVDAGAVLAEELRQAVEALDVRDAAGKPIAVRVSIGVAELSGPPVPEDKGFVELLAAADRCLYRAKAAGRNRVVVEPVESETAYPALA